MRRLLIASLLFAQVAPASTSYGLRSLKGSEHLSRCASGRGLVAKSCDQIRAIDAIDSESCTGRVSFDCGGETLYCPGFPTSELYPTTGTGLTLPVGDAGAMPLSALVGPVADLEVVLYGNRPVWSLQDYLLDADFCDGAYGLSLLTNAYPLEWPWIAPSTQHRACPVISSAPPRLALDTDFDARSYQTRLQGRPADCLGDPRYIRPALHRAEGALLSTSGPLWRYTCPLDGPNELSVAQERTLRGLQRQTYRGGVIVGHDLRACGESLSSIRKRAEREWPEAMTPIEGQSEARVRFYTLTGSGRSLSLEGADLQKRELTGTPPRTPKELCLPNVAETHTSGTRYQRVRTSVLVAHCGQMPSLKNPCWSPEYDEEPISIDLSADGWGAFETFLEDRARPVREIEAFLTSQASDDDTSVDISLTPGHLLLRYAALGSDFQDARQLAQWGECEVTPETFAFTPQQTAYLRAIGALPGDIAGQRVVLAQALELLMASGGWLRLEDLQARTEGSR